MQGRGQGRIGRHTVANEGVLTCGNLRQRVGDDTVVKLTKYDTRLTIMCSNKASS